MTTSKLSCQPQSNIPKWPHTGAIFCGGKSSRMGQPKEIMMLKNGMTLIEHVYHTINPFCKKVVLVGNPRNLPDALEGVKKIQDNIENIGPIGGLEAVLSSGLDDEYLIIPCDLDQIIGDTIKLLVTVKAKMPIVACYKGKVHPLLGRYSLDILQIIKTKIGENQYSLKGILNEIRHTKIEIPDRLAFSLNNVNTLHDFK